MSTDDKLPIGSNPPETTEPRRHEINILFLLIAGFVLWKFFILACNYAKHFSR